LGPIGGLSARQFNGCLPRREEKRREEREERLFASSYVNRTSVKVSLQQDLPLEITLLLNAPK